MLDSTGGMMTSAEQELSGEDLEDCEDVKQAYVFALLEGENILMISNCF